jgi:DNA polymerase-3 subunit alpha
MAASMTLDLGNTDKLAHFRGELDRLGIALLPPDINRSEVTFAVEMDAKTGKPAIRYALAAVKGVGAQAMRDLVAERAKGGPFKDLFDFALRLDAKSFNRRQFENLVKAGAFECLNPNRAQSFAAAELLLRHGSRAAEERQVGQTSLFGDMMFNSASYNSGGRIGHQRPSLPIVADWPAVERLQHEFDAIGFYLSSHPLDPYGRSLERAGILRWTDVPAALAAGGATRFRLAGIVIGKKERTSARGSRYAFVQFSDTSGVFEVTVFSEVLSQTRALIDSGQPLIVTLDVRREDENLRLAAQKIEPLDSVVAHAAAGLRVFVGEAEALPRLKSLIGREAGGRGRVTLVLDLPGSEVEVTLPGGFRVNPGIRAAVKSLPGIIDVHDI